MKLSKKLLVVFGFFGAVSALLTGCNPEPAMPPVMNQNVAAIKSCKDGGISEASCMELYRDQKGSRSVAPNHQAGALSACIAEGLSEDTCLSVMRSVASGQAPQGASSFAGCEAQYGIGKCGASPVPNASGGGSVFLPLAAGAALGAIGGYMLSKNVPKGNSYVPPTDWLKSRPQVSAPHNPVNGVQIGSGISSQKSLENKKATFDDLSSKAKAEAPKVAVKGSSVDPTKFSVPPSTSKAVVPPAAASTSKFSQPVPSSSYANKSSGSGYSSGSYSVKSSPSISRSSSSRSSSRK